ncbi:MAG TPA: FMN-binding protein [Chloroflexota bacterium]|nr:FMN-binding protein [Chloroflexota bacterium]
MTRILSRRSLAPLVLTGLAALPIETMWTGGKAFAAAARASKVVTYKGSTVDSFYGPIQVSILVKGKKIVKVKVGNSPDTARSFFIQGQAIPLLVQETMQAQSTKVDVISGATTTSAAFLDSLKSAVKKAKRAKALK